MKVLFLGDNRNRLNWGCRSTSKALKDIIKERHEIIYTIYGDYTIGYFPLQLRDRIYSFSDRARMALYRRNILKKQILQNDPYNIIKSSVAESYSSYKKMMANNPLKYYKEIDDKIRECEALVCNGEGSFIFSNPPRYDSILYLLWIKIAQEYGKRTYLLNSMFSDCPVTGRNNWTINECKEILQQCSLITARDPLSFNYYLKNIGSNVTFVPDALFSWAKYDDYLPLSKHFSKTYVHFPEYDNKMDEFDFSEPYICLSGSSLAAWSQENASKAYTKLLQALKKEFKVFVVPTCEGDSFLYEVAKDNNCPIIPADTNIFMSMSLLANADVFVSGRWHPSIMASLGGTPCVFMGSNSHKTLAIQHMLEYPQVKEYSAIPSTDEIVQIVTACKTAILMGKTERERIKKIANSLSKKALWNTL